MKRLPDKYRILDFGLRCTGRVKLNQRRQIGFSDMVILNKVDLVGEEQKAEVRQWIDRRLNRVRIVEAVQCDVPLEIRLAVGRFNPLQLADVPKRSSGPAPAIGQHSREILAELGLSDARVAELIDGGVVGAVAG